MSTSVPGGPRAPLPRHWQLYASNRHWRLQRQEASSQIYCLSSPTRLDEYRLGSVDERVGIIISFPNKFTPDSNYKGECTLLEVFSGCDAGKVHLSYYFFCKVRSLIRPRPAQSSTECRIDLHKLRRQADGARRCFHMTQRQNIIVCLSESILGTANLLKDNRVGTASFVRLFLSS